MKTHLVVGAAGAMAAASAGAAAVDVTYDFASVAPGVAASAYAGEHGSALPSDSSSPATEVSAAQYAALEAADGSTCMSSADSNTKYALQRFRFRLAEDPATISAFSVTWVGRGVNGNPGRVDGASVYVWRASGSVFELLAAGADSEAVQTLSQTISSNAADFVDADGDVTILVRSRDRMTGNPHHNRLYTDYISLTLGGGPAGVGPLLAHYTFDEGLGSIVGDSSGNEMHGTAFGGVWTPEGAVQGGMGFAGVDRVVVPDDAVLDVTGDITAMAFIRLDNTAGNQDAVRKGDNYALFDIRGGGAPGVVLSDGAPQTYPFSKAGSFFLGGWHHVAFTYDGSYVRLYIDGHLDATYARTGSLADNNDWLGLGTNGDDDDARFRGLLDDVRLYNVALDPAQIAAVAALHPPSPRIVRWEEVAP